MGTEARPRLSVFRSLNHIYAQVIDDAKQYTLASASTLDSSIVAEAKQKTKIAAAELVGSLIARRARQRGISRVSFDRGGYKYHGRVKALAEAARREGLIF
jgi:large subunit ribosomal protein L18